MKKLFLIAMLLLSSNSYAYNIGGMYATLLSCDWTQWGYVYGHVGTYNANGQIFQVFFGNNYCQY